MEFSPFGDFSGFGGFLFSAVPVIVILGFAAVFAALIVRAGKGARQWRRNNASPVLTVEATLVSKRADVTYHSNAGTENMPLSSSSTEYYAAFEVASGDRMEFRIRGDEYGLLTENDSGLLTFQGTRYLGFERRKN